MACVKPSSRWSVRVAVVAVVCGLETRMKVSKKPLAAPSARYQVVLGASTPAALWPPCIDCQYIVRSTTMGTLFVDSTMAATGPSATVSLTRQARAAGRRHVVGGLDGRAAALAEQLHADGGRLRAGVGDEDVLLEERASGPFRQVPPGLWGLRSGSERVREERGRQRDERARASNQKHAGCFFGVNGIVGTRLRKAMRQGSVQCFGRSQLARYPCAAALLGVETRG